MKTIVFPTVVLALCFLVFLIALATSYPALPERVASHFGIDGQPNGWMSRDGEIDFMLGFGLFIPVFIVVMMASTGWIPVSFVNLPHRDYWFAPERRPSTRAILLRFGLWMASLSLLFFAALQELIVAANAPGTAPHLSNTGIFVVGGGFLAGTIVWALILRRRFSRLPPEVS
jgi:uncharacterized membrane protein